MKKQFRIIILSIFLVVFLCVFVNCNEIWFLKFNLDSEFSLLINENGKVINYIPLNQTAIDKYNDSAFLNVSIDKILKDFVEENEILNLTVIDDNKKRIVKYEKMINNIVREVNNNVVPTFMDVTDDEVRAYNMVTMNNVIDAKQIVYNELNIDIGSDNAFKTDMISHKKIMDVNQISTAIRVSQEMYVDGTDNVILVGVNANADAYSAASFAGILDAPILLVNSIDTVLPENVKTEINRLGAKKIYIIGGNDVVSKKLEDSLKLSYAVERISSSSEIGNAIEIAEYVNLLSEIDSVIVAPYKENLIDSALMAYVSAKYNIPILYSDSSLLNSEVSNFINSNKNIKNVYVVGGSSFYDAISSKINVAKVNLSGLNRYVTNANIINYFDLNFSNIILTNSENDIMYSSQLANKTNSVIIYTRGELVNEQINLLDNKNINNVYYLGDSDIKYAFRDLMFQINKLNYSSVEELLFMKSRVVFYIPHQDDETSFHSQTILNAIRYLGAENVFLVFMTDGNSSRKIYDKEIAQWLHSKNLTFSKARDLESIEALMVLGVPRDNIKFVEELEFVNQKRFVDGSLRYNIENLKKVMMAFDNKYGGDITHFSYTPYFDGHYDHKSLGQALTELYFDSTIDDDSFSSVYFIIRSDIIQVYPDIDHYTNYQNKLLKLTYNNDVENKKILDAIDVFKDNKENGKIGIGYRSGKKAFDYIYEKAKNNMLETPIHIPFIR